MPVQGKFSRTEGCHSLQPEPSPDGTKPLRERFRRMNASAGTEGTPLAANALASGAHYQMNLATDERGYGQMPAGSGIWALNLLTDELVVSPRLHGVLGLSTDGPFKAVDFFAIVHPDDLQATSIAFALATHPKVRATYDVTYRTIGKADGVTRWVAAKGVGVFDDDGFCIRAVGTATRIDGLGRGVIWNAGQPDPGHRNASDRTFSSVSDFLEQPAAFDGLQAGEPKNRWFDYRGHRVRVVDRTGKPEFWNQGAQADARAAQDGARAWKALPELLCVVTADGALCSVNAAWTQLLGWQPDELLGHRYLAFSHSGDNEAIATAMAGAVEAHQPSHECRMLHKDGSLRWVAWSVSGDGFGLFASGRDVTAEKAASDAANEAEALLRQNQKMEAIGQLAGGIAHDFNNLLQALSGGLELLGRRHVHSEAGRLLIRRADAAVERGSMLTKQLLCFSGKQHLATQTIDVNGMIAMSSAFIGRLLEAVEIHWTLAPQLWPALADPNQLDVALLNLLVNARDAMPAGGTIEVATRNLAADERLPAELAAGDYVAIAVTDTGVGMSEEVLLRAIEPFFTTKGMGRGSGLGLSQAYGFARQSGGALRLTSLRGHGSVVEILLPRAVPAAAGMVRPHPELLLRPKTILVVDDDQDVRELTVAALEERGYRVMEADGGISGLALLAEAPVDLLLVDFAMPGMTGAEMVRLARKASPGIGVLFMTGYADLDALREYAAPEDILRKPFRLATLIEHVASVTGRIIS